MRSLAFFTLLVPSAHAADLIVGPGGFSCIRDAVAAANPGDRILVDGVNGSGQCFQGGRTVFDRDLIVQGIGRPVVNFEELFNESWEITASVSFRGFSFRFQDWDCVTPNPIRVSSPSGIVEFDDCTFFMTTVGCVPSPWSMLDATCQSLRLRSCRFGFTRGIRDRTWSNYINFPAPLGGASCLRVRAAELLLEDCDIQASNALDITDVPAGVTPMTAGFGDGAGAAIDATVARPVYVRCTFADGNGGTWGRNPFAPPVGDFAPEGHSKFGTTPVFYDCEWTDGQPGTAGPGTPVDLGSATAAFELIRGQVGGTLEATYAHGSGPVPLGFVMGFRFQAVDVGALGTLATLPVVGFGLSPSGPGAAFNVPNQPSLAGLLVVCQAVLTQPLELGNPSALRLRLP